MKIKNTVLKEMQKLINNWADGCKQFEIENYFKYCQQKAQKDPVVMFCSNFYSIYNQAIKNLNMNNDRSINDSHIITAVKHCLKNNEKTSFIFKK